MTTSPVAASDSENFAAQCRALSQRVATYTQRTVGEGDALAEEIKQLQKAVKKARDELSEDDTHEAEELRLAKAILEGHGPGGDLRKLLKQRTPLLLRLLLGQHTNVITLQRRDAIRIKEEYHSFRDRSAFLLFAFSLGLLVGLLRAQSRMAANEPFTFTPPFMVGVQAFLCWLLYDYTAMALRENVLKVNGSSIRSWWIHHHYWSMAMLLLLLALPVDSPSVQMCVKNFLWWSCLQGAVMLVQNRYQRRRMYTRIALGKNSAMDVVSGESSGGYGQLLLLYPMLFGLQALQFFIGFEIVLRTWRSLFDPEGWLDLERHESDLRGSRGVSIAGALMLGMALCNFRNTVATILEKRQIRRKAGRRGMGSKDVSPAKQLALPNSRANGQLGAGKPPKPVSPNPARPDTIYEASEPEQKSGSKSKST
ncbi:hypothetical protein WJX72_011969 [[Myrmecia] bisecta]|uniref:Uncharacterized protein n=1 Tax=[Myrmecia] bisecta TaxID=41462 RepID=A0AAW1Q8G8_9CHLO